jgi:hypothetical protein
VTGNLGPLAEPGAAGTPAGKTRDVRAEQRLFALREHEKTERIRALNGLPPLETEPPPEGATCPWHADDEGDATQATAW